MSLTVSKLAENVIVYPFFFALPLNCIISNSVIQNVGGEQVIQNNTPSGQPYSTLLVVRLGQG